MARRDRLVLAGFVAWTAFVWVQRLVNLASDDTSGAAAVRSGALAVAMLGFVVAAVVVLVRGAAASWRRPTRLEARVVQAFAAWTVAVWVVRAVEITLAWRSPGFVVVHVVLAAVSIVLAVGSWRAVTRRMAPVVAAG